MMVVNRSRALLGSRSPGARGSPPARDLLAVLTGARDLLLCPGSQISAALQRHQTGLRGKRPRSACVLAWRCGPAPSPPSGQQLADRPHRAGTGGQREVGRWVGAQQLVGKKTARLAELQRHLLGLGWAVGGAAWRSLHDA